MRSSRATAASAPCLRHGQHHGARQKTEKSKMLQQHRQRMQHCCRANTSESTTTEVDDAAEEPLKVNDQTGVSAWSFAKSVVQVTGLQIACGFVVSPVAANLLEDVHIPPVFGPLIGQLSLIGAAGFVIDRCLKEGNNSEEVFFRYIAKPTLLIQAVLAASLALGIALLLNRQAGGYPATTSLDVQTLLDTDVPSTMAATGLTTVAITPWVEERIFRGFILQGAIPFLGVPGAVIASSVLYAGSHLSLYGFPQLLALGLLLGSLHVYAQRNLLLPTFTHSLFNTAILVAVLLSLPPQVMEPTIPPSVADAAEQAANVIAPAVTDAVTKD